MAIRVTPLETAHEVKEFDCGTKELNDFLRTTASQHQRKSISKTYVLIEDESPTVIMGFYTVAIRKMVCKESLPVEMKKRMPSDIPGFTLARLAVSIHHQGKSYGEYLLAHAMGRVAKAAAQVGGYALFVDAKNSSAASFYEKYGFTRFPDDPLTMCIKITDIPV